MESSEDLPLKKKKKQTRVTSDAFPPNILGGKKKQPSFSEVHKKLREIEVDESKINYRELNYGDMEEIKCLHKEWFPLDYSDEYFEHILNPEKRRKNYITLAATYPYNNEELILGAVITEINNKNEFTTQVSESIIQNLEIPFLEDINFFRQDFECAYIMIIGIVDEMRRLKLGTKILNRIIDTYLEKTSCICIYLHVISHNQSAINFYVKNNFILAGNFKNYYKIQNEYYDSNVYVKCFSKTERDKNKNMVMKIIDTVSQALSLFIFILTIGYFFKMCRRKHKLD